MKGQRRDVTKRPDGQWQDRAEDASRPASLHRPNGQIRDADTINRPDPYPPPDTKH